MSASNSDVACAHEGTPWLRAVRVPRGSEGGCVSAVLAFDGCYDAPRAAALSGVPRSTVYDWAVKGIVVPSISQEREKLWSYADLMALRIVSWLRRPMALDDERRPASAMREVRQALAKLDELAFEGAEGACGPDLRRPRPHLRIVPGKRAGEPHLDGSRLTTMTVAALSARGYTVDDLALLYPDEDRASLAEAVDLERILGTLDRAA